MARCGRWPLVGVHLFRARTWIVSGRLAHRVGKPLVIVGTAMTAVGLAATSLRA
ncbi:hypothetical protein ACFY20_44380 [Streptomyces sp. NPDC001312]|uniref:hypothetical protein n=1 Tax=Streptomyces sp. NPDC001312 TaxID=3364561 RepID=UPI0036D03D95